MDKGEIEQYLAIGGPLLICVDVREEPSFPGYVRTVTMFRDLSVAIEYVMCALYAEDDMEGPDIGYRGVYTALEDMIADLEEFLSLRHQDWVNYTRNRYSPQHTNPTAETQAQLGELAECNGVSLPTTSKCTYTLTT